MDFTELTTQHFFRFESLPEGKSNEDVFLYQWLRVEGDFVRKGDPLYRVRVGTKLTSILSFVSQPHESESDGIFCPLVKEDDQITKDKPFSKIYPIGQYEKENLPTKQTYHFHFDKYKYGIPEKYQHHNFAIKEWHKQDGELVNQGDLILTLKYVTSYRNQDVMPHYAEKTGFLDIHNEGLGKYSSYELEQNKTIYSIHSLEQDRVRRKYTMEPRIETDEFTKYKKITWKFVGDCLSSPFGVISYGDGNVSLGFSFNSIEKKDYIVFRFVTKEFMLKIGDSVSFLFDNAQAISFIISNEPYKVSTYKSEKTFESKVLIAESELNLFQNSNLLGWKISLKKQNHEILGGEKGVYSYERKANLNIVIREFAKKYNELVRKELPDYSPLISRDDSKITNSDNRIDNEECFVYLMIDITNQFYKIGISSNPEWREKTLQSEKPSIELIAYKKFVSRRIAKSLEKALHETYREKRIRGEWFRLDESDVWEIKITLNG